MDATNQEARSPEMKMDVDLSFDPEAGKHNNTESSSPEMEMELDSHTPPTDTQERSLNAGDSFITNHRNIDSSSNFPPSDGSELPTREQALEQLKSMYSNANSDDLNIYVNNLITKNRVQADNEWLQSLAAIDAPHGQLAADFGYLFPDASAPGEAPRQAEQSDQSNESDRDTSTGQDQPGNESQVPEHGEESAAVQTQSTEVSAAIQNNRESQPTGLEYAPTPTAIIPPHVGSVRINKRDKNLLNTFAPLDYVMPEGPPLNFTAVEIIVFLPNWIRNQWITTRFINNNISSRHHISIWSRHRQWNANDPRCITMDRISDYMRQSMRLGNSSWTRKSHVTPKDWNALNISVNDFVPDRIRESNCRNQPDSVLFTTLKDGVRHMPTGYDAADLTRAIEWASNHTVRGSDGQDRFLVFPDDIHLILQTIGYTTVCAEHSDGHAFRRCDDLKMQAEAALKDALASNDFDGSASDSPAMTPQAASYPPPAWAGTPGSPAATTADLSQPAQSSGPSSPAPQAPHPLPPDPFADSPRPLPQLEYHPMLDGQRVSFMRSPAQTVSPFQPAQASNSSTPAQATQMSSPFLPSSTTTGPQSIQSTNESSPASQMSRPFSTLLMENPPQCLQPHNQDQAPRVPQMGVLVPHNPTMPPYQAQSARQSSNNQPPPPPAQPTQPATHHQQSTLDSMLHDYTFSTTRRPSRRATTTINPTPTPTPHPHTHEDFQLAATMPTIGLIRDSNSADFNVFSEVGDIIRFTQRPENRGFDWRWEDALHVKAVRDALKWEREGVARAADILF